MIIKPKNIEHEILYYTDPSQSLVDSDMDIIRKRDKEMKDITEKKSTENDIAEKKSSTSSSNGSITSDSTKSLKTEKLLKTEKSLKTEELVPATSINSMETESGSEETATPNENFNKSHLTSLERATVESLEKETATVESVEKETSVESVEKETAEVESIEKETAEMDCEEAIKTDCDDSICTVSKMESSSQSVDGMAEVNCQDDVNSSDSRSLPTASTETQENKGE